MGIYSRYKRDPDGFRKLVELLETTPVTRRQKMIDVGMDEDPVYTQKALEFMLTFKDLLEMEETELMEVLAEAPVKMSAISVSKLDEKIKEHFIKCTPVRFVSEFKEYSEIEYSLSEVGGAQLKLVSAARRLEKINKIKTKKIPSSVG
ncbi:MAG: hypothetical protein CL678_17280 [Bdellovibrionaceae bacterium]|nr:hypothetical protein [Pseudobdellovibrionaceae bacterium]|tara:strand:- start:1947 stop:2390 length:444 start_codon:yes stop_codon:yes gene_type:complete